MRTYDDSPCTFWKAPIELQDVRKKHTIFGQGLTYARDTQRTIASRLPLGSGSDAIYKYNSSYSYNLFINTLSAKHLRAGPAPKS